MNIKVSRFAADDETTISLVTVDGEFVCFGLEDEYREIKIPGETRIPAGLYQLKLRKHGGSSCYRLSASVWPMFWSKSTRTPSPNSALSKSGPGPFDIRMVAHMPEYAARGEYAYRARGLVERCETWGIANPFHKFEVFGPMVDFFVVATPIQRKERFE